LLLWESLFALSDLLCKDLTKFLNSLEEPELRLDHERVPHDFISDPLVHSVHDDFVSLSELFLGEGPQDEQFLLDREDASMDVVVRSLQDPLRVSHVLESQLILASSMEAVKDDVVALCSGNLIQTNHLLSQHLFLLDIRFAVGHNQKCGR